jgi:hypothetical protein
MAVPVALSRPWPQGSPQPIVFAPPEDSSDASHRTTPPMRAAVEHLPPSSSFRNHLCPPSAPHSSLGEQPLRRSPPQCRAALRTFNILHLRPGQELTAAPPTSRPHDLLKNLLTLPYAVEKEGASA